MWFLIYDYIVCPPIDDDKMNSSTLVMMGLMSPALLPETTQTFWLVHIGMCDIPAEAKSIKMSIASKCGISAGIK
jgi:hypothetical protein